MSKQSMVVGFDEILTTIWGDPNWGGGKQMIKVHVKRLREKIEADPHEPKVILNHWGRGYLFAPEVVEELTDQNYLSVRDLSKEYTDNRGETYQALNRINLDIEKR